jgi:methionine-R-sulfoxide reductase
MTEPNSDDLKARLTPEQYNVTQKAGTERAFSGKYWDEKRSGTYKCVVCEEPLFASDTKFDSGSGWPSFTTPLQGAPIEEHTDRSFGMSRTESTCGNCGAHLGHVFDDGPRDQGGLRYCINSASLELDPEEPA